MIGLLRCPRYEINQDRVEVLAKKCNKGMLSAEEREEYETCIRASNFIGLLKAEARLYLKNHPQA